MTRKIVICLLTTALLSIAPLVEAQQTGKVARIGYLSPVSAERGKSLLAAFQQGLQELGYTAGKNIVIEQRYAEGKRDRLPALAAELVRLKVDVIVTAADPAIRAAKRATGTIPIVMCTTGDPIASGLVVSLARPGGNLTGLTALGTELSEKRLELLKEAVPRASRVAVLSTPASPEAEPSIKGMEAVAGSLGVQLRVVEIRDPTELEKAFTAIAREGAGAVMVLTSPIFTTHRRRIVELTIKHRLPAMYPISEFVDAGALMFYGASLPDMFYRAATYVHKILKGAEPADLPVEQPTKFEFVINLKTAKQIGLTIPPNVLARADKVIR
jgi:putative ABC transport system substrate-binding protein